MLYDLMEHRCLSNQNIGELIETQQILYSDQDQTHEKENIIHY